jgi:hypothetical protein
MLAIVYDDVCMHVCVCMCALYCAVFFSILSFSFTTTFAMIKPKISKPKKTVDYISDGIFKDACRDDIVTNIQKLIFVESKTSKDVRIVIDPVIVNGLWAYIRQQLVSSVLHHLPDKFVTKADEINIKNLLDTVAENIILFTNHILPNDHIRKEFIDIRGGEMIYRESERNQRKYARCLITGLPLSDGEPVDRIELNSKSLFVSQRKHWCNGKLNTLTLFNLFWEQRQFERVVLNCILSNPFYEHGKSRTVVNTISQSEEIREFMVAMILHFQLITDTLKEIITSGGGGGEKKGIAN